MALELHTLKPARGSTKKRWVVGRGHGSGIGKTSGRGMKGQTARSGVSGLKLKGFRHLMLAIPKSRGFTSGYKKVTTISLAELSREFGAKETVTYEALRLKKLLQRNERDVKIVGVGKVKTALNIKSVPVSAGAKKAIEAAGGSVK